MTARLVYSTDGGELPREKRPVGKVLAPAEHDVRVRPERGGRKGKTVTCCAPFHLESKVATALCKRIKQRCGSGGTVKTTDEGLAIEIQGDHVDTVLAELAAQGYPAKRGGG